MEAPMLTLKLPPDMDARLDVVAKRLGKSKQDIALGAVLEEIEDLEDGLIALERLSSGEPEYATIDEVRERLGLRSPES
jgi:RHH-type rel operon transcriptional repressor/antitoxin RelB